MKFMKTTNGIPIPDKPFLDIGITVDNYKLNAFTKRLSELGYKAKIFPFTSKTTVLKILQVPKERLEEMRNEITKLEISIKRSN
jgi:hypothetical protein